MGEKPEIKFLLLLFVITVVVFARMFWPVLN